MSPIASFVTGVAITFIGALTAVVYLRRHLQEILTDLCGTAERAGFWTAFSSICLVTVPLIFSLYPRPEGGSWSVSIFDIGTQLRWSLIGLVLTLLVLGRTISKSVPCATDSN
jgi:hypothetical protein